MVDQRTYYPAMLAMGFRRHQGRGLCVNCYGTELNAGRLDQWPRMNRPGTELLEDWELLRDAGVPLGQAAKRMDISLAALDRALHRATRNGDERGRHTGCRTAEIESRSS
jgi:hypothetical protein